jgi:hypothetical protein
LSLQVKEFELKDRNFSTSGNFGFGIDEHIDLGLKYDPQVGIYGMDFYACLSRPGFRTSRKKAKRGYVLATAYLRSLLCCLLCIVVCSCDDQLCSQISRSTATLHTTHVLQPHRSAPQDHQGGGAELVQAEVRRTAEGLKW